MNKFLNMLERKIGKYAISRLPLIMIICYAVGYLMQVINPEIINVVSLNPYAILKGQVWRLITWVLIPPDSSNLFFTLIMLYFYYSIGTNLERTWGNFYFNYYIFSGMIFTIIASFIVYGFFAITSPSLMVQDADWLVGYSVFFAQMSRLFFSTYYINMSIFLAFAATYPDVQILLFFIIPIKVKVMGFVYVGLMIYESLFYWINYGMFVFTLVNLFVIFASLLNFILFFVALKGNRRRSASQIKAAKEYKRKAENAKMQAAKVSKHKCAICGRTNDSNPDLEFRFCSKCNGNYEYCQDHLFTHVHKGEQ